MISPTSDTVTVDEFSFIRTLGIGTFARVSLVEHKITGKRYAIKSMLKSDVLRLRQVDHVLNEKRILSQLAHRNITQLAATFNDKTHIYLVLEYISGGELFYLLRKAVRFSDRTAAFYAANIVHALDHLHSHRIVYRDLKPENVLVAENGYLKLADFGFAKEIGLRTHSICGTPEYIAPEIIQNKGHSLEVDWWALGILIYEMLTGKPPFQDVDKNALYKQIIEDEVEPSRHIGSVANDLIKKLLVVDPSHRLGHINDAADIINHPWFSEIDFDKIANQTFPAPSTSEQSRWSHTLF